MNISNEWIIKDPFFGKFSEMPINFETIHTFIHKFLYNEPNNKLLMQELSNLYVLIAFKGSEKYLKNCEKKWCDILNNKEDLKILEKEHFNVIVYVNRQ